MEARHAALIGIAIVTVVACGPPPPEAPMPAEATVLLEGIELPARVEGELGGVRFEARDVRYRVVQGERRDRVDLYFSDRPIERCGLPIARQDTLLWLRLPQRTALEVGELTTEAGGLEVHYERPGEEGIDAVHRGVARVSIASVDDGLVEGALRVCFADVEGSCVGGRFRATPCLSRIDGRALREAPGLADDAIEASGEVP